jgi:hypothetical protein
LPRGDGGADAWQSASKAAYQPLKGERSEPADPDLRSTHIVLGADCIREQTSLYRDTFKGSQGLQSRVDGNAMRAFHTSHHTNFGGAAEQGPLLSTNKESFVPHPGLRPRSPIQFGQIEHVITPGDASLTVNQSSMRAAYVPHPNMAVNRPINNLLQQSHIVSTSGARDDWTTTQQDYFQFKTYKFD